jgi:hypothetical protein
MEAGNGGRASSRDYCLAGVETGVLATLAMLVWLGLTSAWYRRSFWTAANLLASTFYGESVLRNRFTWHTFSGLALFLVIYGTLGALFALAIQNRPGSVRITCWGILLAIGWYYLIFGWLWKHWNPLVVLYTQDRPMFLGHVLYGALLGFYPRYLRRLRPAAPPLIKNPGQAERPAPLALE